ncbi:hypothetical protein B0T14DRAFT_501623 [Immersiella caudata]|uniref:Uncharacterized protein n=1 Tax=Immersiella caudata TaxID=314043 RepID=A0AA39XD15_9PEZI|nr:hypothetical protein B0T14DRAFT_501623 [Immersiella caudata]
MDGLIKEGIVPHPSVDDEVQEMTDAEARRLARELLEMRRVRLASIWYCPSVEMWRSETCCWL